MYATSVVLTPFPNQLPNGLRIAYEEIRLKRDENEELFGRYLRAGGTVIIETVVPGYGQFPVEYVISQVRPNPEGEVGIENILVIEDEDQYSNGHAIKEAWKSYLAGVNSDRIDWLKDEIAKAPEHDLHGSEIKRLEDWLNSLTA